MLWAGSAISLANTSNNGENHGGYSSDGKWLMNVIRSLSRSNVGTLPDFGNFCISGSWGSTQEECSNKYDKYLGVKEMMPYAKSVSAKSYDFDEEGNCVEVNPCWGDYRVDSSDQCLSKEEHRAWSSPIYISKN